jgi:hypothetical protein
MLKYAHLDFFSNQFHKMSERGSESDNDDNTV